MINNTISECSKLIQKECKTKHDWVGKMIQWEVCKNFEFDHTTKRYVYKWVSVLENETHQILWDFKI